MDTAGNIKRHICYGQNGREPLEVFKLAILAAPKLRPGSYDYRAIHGVYHSQVYPASKSHKMLQDWTERRFTRFRGGLRNQSDPLETLTESRQRCNRRHTFCRAGTGKEQHPPARNHRLVDL